MGSEDALSADDFLCRARRLDLMPGEYGAFGDWRGPGEPGHPFGSVVLEFWPLLSMYGELKSGRESFALVATDVSGA